MKAKKSQKADLESKRNTFFLIGLVIALGGTLLAFEYTTKARQVEDLGSVISQDVEEQIIPITREKEIIPPPPPPPPKVVEVLNIVENDEIIEDELEIMDTEADDKTAIDIQPIFEAEEEEDDEDLNKIFLFADEKPEFPGGDRALYRYISDHVNYPVVAQENGIEGKVYVKFVVNETGKVSDSQILRGVDISLDKEALRVINTLPKFRPGKQNGRPVKVYYNAVINYQLQ